MDNRGNIIPCRVVPFEGPADARVVGPANGPCYAGAWSADGKWIYLNVAPTSRTSGDSVSRMESLSRLHSGQPRKKVLRWPRMVNRGE